MMKATLIRVMLCFFIALPSYAQDITQTIRGKVVDSESKYPLPGVNVVVISSDGGILQGASTDLDGNYRLENIPVGRRTVRFTYIGYKETLLDNIIVSSAKEVILNIDLAEAVTELEDIVVTATRNGEVSNEMATISARQFSVDETDRYAGSRGDPARMASNFAGVQGADDSRNDIVVRGNAPTGVLWQIEGIPIFNPNHFNIPGTGGGSVNIINNKVLANSDFYTGAFPAEYGNALAGVFDIKYRAGNNQKFETSAQLGLIGLELASEGPINRDKGSSYVATYRYSTLAALRFLPINVGTIGTPFYQDVNFKLNFPQSNGGSLAFWGLGGASRLNEILSTRAPDNDNLYGANNRDQYFDTNMGMAGMTYTLPVDANTFFKFSAAAGRERSNSYHELIYRSSQPNTGQTGCLDGSTDTECWVLDSLPAVQEYMFQTWKTSFHGMYYKKLNKRNTLNIGLQGDVFFWNFYDSARVLDSEDPRFFNFITRWNADESGVLVQPYVQWKHKFNDQLSMNVGVHAQYFTQGNALSPFEPRFGLKYDIDKTSSLSLGISVHSQVQQHYLYFFSDSLDNSGNRIEYNRDMDLSYNSHYIVGYDKVLGNNTRLKLEAYYQYLWNIPVAVEPGSFSLANQGSGFVRLSPPPLENTATGRNFGVEFTLERFFSSGFYFLVTGSVFDSKYRGSDGNLYNTNFNGNFMFNGLAAYEHTFKKNNTLSVGTNLTYGGGPRTGPVDLARSAILQEPVFIDNLRNTERFRPYFRPDIRISYKVNKPRLTHEVAFDFINFLGYQNILNVKYVDDPDNPIQENYQLDFLPIFYYKVDF